MMMKEAASNTKAASGENDATVLQLVAAADLPGTIYILSENELQTSFVVYGILFGGLLFPRASKGSASASYDLVECSEHCHHFGISFMQRSIKNVKHQDYKAFRKLFAFATCTELSSCIVLWSEIAFGIFHCARLFGVELLLVLAS